MEGRVFVCSWKETATGYRVWVTKRPKLAAEASTFAEADELLSEVICDATGDGENLHEYSPPAPKSGTETPSLPRLALAAANGRAEVDNGAALFHGGFCTQCGSALGRRTDVIAELGKVDAGADAVMARLSRWAVNPSFYSDAFLGLLHPSERAGLLLRPTKRKGTAKKAFFELLGGVRSVPRVAVRGFPFEGAWRCDACGRECSPFYIGREPTPWRQPPSYYVAAEDLPAETTCCVVGDGPDARLCFTPERWQELVGRPGTKGVKTSDLGVLAPSLVERAPDRVLLSELERAAQA